MRATLPPITGYYLAAHFGKSLFWHAGELLFAFFLSEMCGLSVHAVGDMLAFSLLVSAVGDAWFGHVLARIVQDIPSASRMQCVGAAAAAILFLALATVGMAPQTGRAWAAATILVGFRLAYSLYDVPQNAILAFAAQTELVGSRL